MKKEKQIFNYLKNLDAEIDEEGKKMSPIDLVNSSVDVENLVSFPLGVYYIIGKYLKETDWPYDKRREYEAVYYHFILKIVDKHVLTFPDLSKNLDLLKGKMVREYVNFIEQQKIYFKRVTDNDEAFAKGHKSFQNSSHLQDAVKDLKYLLESAEILFDEKMVKEMKEKIHQFQAG